MTTTIQPRYLHRLSAATVRTLTTPGWHADGGGLYLEIDTNGRKRWVMRLTVNGRRRDFGLGPIHKVSLLQARQTASTYRSLTYQGIDPKTARHPNVENAVPTFEEAAREVYKQRQGTWSNGKHVGQWINTLQDYAFPVIGSKPVNAVGTPDVLKVLDPIWTTKPETARRIRQRLRVVLDWARAAGHRHGDNPVDLIGDALPRQKKEVEHHAALPYGEVAAFIAKLRASNSEPITKLAFEFLILTATRSKDTRGARWSEIALADKLWTIPGDDGQGRRMKAGQEHIVPLPRRCLQIVDQAKTLAGHNELVFPDSQTGRMMSENRFLTVRDRLGYTKVDCTPHGFRSSFRDWAAEETSFPSEVAEMALAHTIKSKVEAAYRRGHLLTKRRELMTAWAEYVVPVSSEG